MKNSSLYLGLEASAFFALQNNFCCYEKQQLILGTGTAIWLVTEPHSMEFFQFISQRIVTRGK